MVNDPFKALSHPIRRGIVERLAAGPATVGDATGGFGVSKPAISKHLKVLEETGVVTRVVEGRTHRLSLEPDVLSEAADWMDRQRALWGRLFDVVDEYLKEEAVAMNTPPIVSPQEWEAAREELLVKEKELTRARDALAAERRRMPRMAVEKDYAFEGPDGPASLLDLFDGRRQLIVYRFFFEPGVAGWPERGCPGCSFVADQVAHLAHLNARDTTLAFVSRAPQADIERWKARMGWDDPVVHDHRRLRRRLRRGRVARHQRLPPRRRRPDLPHLLRQQPRRRGDGQHLELPRHHRARAPGGVGGLAGGLPADPAVPVVEPARRVRRTPHDRPRRAACRSRRLLPVGGAARAPGCCVARAWIMLRLRRRREPGDVSDNTTLRMERTFQAPAQAVFDAWTSEEVMRRWWHAEHDWETTEAEVDLRVGGAVRVVMRNPHEDVEYGGGGRYTEIEPADPPGVHLDLGRRHHADS